MTKKTIGGSAAGVLAAILYALFGRGGGTPPQPTTHVFDVVLCADGPDEQHGAEFVCNQRVAGRVSAETATEQWTASDTDTAGYVTFSAPPVPSPSRLKLEASGYETRYVQGFRFEACAEGCHNVYTLTSLTPPPPPPPPRPFPPDTGRLRANGDHFDTVANEPWGWRGQTHFLLFARYLRGEDIQPQIDKLVEKGINVARVFVAGVDWSSWPDYHRPFDRPDYAERLGAFVDLLWAAGIRTEATVVTYRIDTATWRRVLQQVYGVGAPRTDRMFVEVTNEPWMGWGDPAEVASGIDRHGVLSAYGLQPMDGDTDASKVAKLDYLTIHLPRDPQHFPRNSKDLLEAKSAGGKATVGDEPLGFIDPDFIDRTLNPNAREMSPGLWSMDGRGGGARTTSVEWYVSHFAICRLFSMGCTEHPQSGLEGKVPTPGEERAMDAVLQVWLFIPASAQTCAYSAPHLGNFPIVWTDADSTVGHAYAAICGNTAWLVNPLPRTGWTATPANGWSVAAVGPRPWILKLTR